MEVKYKKGAPPVVKLFGKILTLTRHQAVMSRISISNQLLEPVNPKLDEDEDGT